VPQAKQWAAIASALAAARPWVVLKILQSCQTFFWPLALPLPYCSSFKTSCCTLLAWASAAMPVCERISYFDMSEVAVA
jgi:hypothetical protein